MIRPRASTSSSPSLAHQECSTPRLRTPLKISFNKCGSKGLAHYLPRPPRHEENKVEQKVAYTVYSAKPSVSSEKRLGLGDMNNVSMQRINSVKDIGSAKPPMQAERIQKERPRIPLPKPLQRIQSSLQKPNKLIKQSFINELTALVDEPHRSESLIPRPPVPQQNSKGQVYIERRQSDARQPKSQQSKNRSLTYRNPSADKKKIFNASGKFEITLKKSERDRSLNPERRHQHCRHESAPYCPPSPTPPADNKIQQQPQSQKPTTNSQKDKMNYTNENSSTLFEDGTFGMKLVLVGDGSVGKTSLLTSYTTNQFPNEYTPTVFDNYAADVLCGDRKVKLWLWDTAGQEEYVNLRLLSYKKADVIFICFSLVDEDSYTNAIKRWYSEVQEECPNAIKIFVGTKSDLHHEYLQDPNKSHKAIPLSKIKKECSSKKCDFYPCSGLNQQGLNEVFTKSILKTIERKEKKNEDIEAPLCQLI